MYTTLKSRIVRSLAAVGAALALTVVPAATAPTAADAATCSTPWGSLTEVRNVFRSQVVRNVRAGRHTCFDRLVIDLRGSRPTGYRVSYVSQVHRPGSGQVVPLAGGARLLVSVKAPAYDNDGDATYDPANPNRLVNVAGFRTFRQVALAGSFEGITDIGLGVRARLPFRVFTLDDGSTTRMVIDVAHHW
jgi:hypothetical protein